MDLAIICYIAPSARKDIAPSARKGYCVFGAKGLGPTKSWRKVVIDNFENRDFLQISRIKNFGAYLGVETVGAKFTRGN